LGFQGYLALILSFKEIFNLTCFLLCLFSPGMASRILFYIYEKIIPSSLYSRNLKEHEFSLQKELIFDILNLLKTQFPALPDAGIK